MRDAFTRLSAAAGETLINVLDLKDNMKAVGNFAETIAKRLIFKRSS